MKQLLIIVSILFAISCQNTAKDDLASKKESLLEKKAELSALEAEIKTLKSEIDGLEPPKEKQAALVEAIRLSPKTFERRVEVQGRVKADDVVNVSSEIGGRILKLYVKEGQRVKRSQLIATTDMSTLEKQIAEIENKLQLASTVYERQKRLWDQNIGSEIQFLEAKTAKDGLERSLETLNSQIKKKNLYAPIAGIVDKEFLQAGELAAPGMPVVQILNTSKIKVVADVQENFLNSIQKGDELKIYFPAIDLTIEEKVTQVGRTIDLNNRTFKIEVLTDSQNGVLKPNLLSVVEFIDYKEENVLTVPTHLIQEEVNGKKFIYRINEENGNKIAKKSYIEIGESDTDEIILRAGVEPGDEIISLGAKSITDGDRIRIKA